ncbi:bifunctional nuclease family protein [Candidatus Nanopelagicales bacterium]|nr:bifunctional nuclease family protein [Candidatus Nanopelagicales bacterium]
MKVLDVVGVRVEVPSNQPVVLLREAGTVRHIPIWIGANEATAIALAQEGVQPPRPQTHDLIVNLLDAVGEQLQQVRITHLDDGVFFALLVFKSGVELGARPSDAIALALRVGAPVLAADEVVEAAGVEILDETEALDSKAAEPTADAEQELAQFRDFLADINPEDFDRPPAADDSSGPTQ